MPSSNHRSPSSPRCSTSPSLQPDESALSTANRPTENQHTDDMTTFVPYSPHASGATYFQSSASPLSPSRTGLRSVPCLGDQGKSSQTTEEDVVHDIHPNPDLPFDKVSDLFRCKPEAFGRPVPHPVDVEQYVQGPNCAWRPPNCICYKEDGTPFDGTSLSKHTEKRLNQKDPWERLTFYFKGRYPRPGDKLSEVGKAWTVLRRVMVDEGTEMVYLIYDSDDRTRADLYVHWPSIDKLSKFYETTALDHALHNLEQHLKSPMRREHGVPFDPLVGGLQERRLEIVDLKLSKADDFTRRTFERRLTHFLETMLPVSNLHHQPVQAEADGWVDPKLDTCSHGLQDEGTDTYRVVLYWDDVDSELQWVRKFMELPAFLAGHRATNLSGLLESVESRHAALKIDWPDQVLDYESEDEGYDSDASKASFYCIDFD